MGKDKAALAVVPQWTPAQADALNGLHEAMGNFFNATMACHQEGIAVADAFEAIGFEIPKALRPAINILASKFPDKKE